MLDVVNAVLDYNMAVEKNDYLEKKYQLQKEIYEAHQSKYNLGMAEYDALLDEEETYQQVKQDYYNGQKNLLSSQQTCFALLGKFQEDMVLPAISLESLLKLVNTRTETLHSQKGRSVITEKILALHIELKSLEKKLKQTYPLQPSLKLSSEMNIPLSSVNAKVTFSLSSSQIAFDEQDDLKKEISLKKAFIRESEYMAGLEIKTLEKALTIAEQERDTARRDLENAETFYQEVRFLYENGERTSLELRQAELNREFAGNMLYSSVVGMYKIQGELSMYY
jgi:hypothetical protein